MSKIEMDKDKIVSTVEGNGQKSTVTTTASTITLNASKITLGGLVIFNAISKI